MIVPQEWIDEVINRLKANPGISMAFGNHREIIDQQYIDAVRSFLDMPINKEWELDIKCYGEKFKDFFVSITTHQCSHNMHPLTCCSAHEILVPRINYKEQCYLVCPTCGWIQLSEHVPIMF